MSLGPFLTNGEKGTGLSRGSAVPAAIRWCPTKHFAAPSRPLMHSWLAAGWS